MSQKKGGAYPLDEEHFQSIINLFQPSSSPRRVLDPFSHTGEFIEAFSKALNLTAHTIEIQEGFAKEAQARFGPGRALHDDAYEVSISDGSFPIIYLNPPYIENPTAGRGFKREETKAVRHFLPKLQDNGYMILVMYAHNAKELFSVFMRRFNSLHVYRLPGKHLGRYDQLVFIARRDVKAPQHTDAWIQENRAVFDDWMDNPEKIPDITRGPVYNKGGARYKMPPPAQVRRFRFEPKSISWKSVEPHLIQSGAHLLPEIQKLFSPIVTDQIVRTVHEPHLSHLAILTTSDILSGIPVTHEGRPALLRGSTKRVKRLVKTEDDTDKHGGHVSLETYYDQPSPVITVLTEDGRVIEFEEKRIPDAIRTYENSIKAAVKSKLKPLYDKRIYKAWRETFNMHLVEGKFRMFPQQQHYAAALTEQALVFGKFIGSAQMRFGKTPITIATIINLHKVGQWVAYSETNPQYAKELDSLLYRLSRIHGRAVKAKDLHVISPGQVVLIGCPANLPDEWMLAINRMSSDIKIRRVNNAVTLRELYDSADAEPDTLYVGITTFQDMKLGEGWRPAYTKYGGMQRYSRVPVTDEKGSIVRNPDGTTKTRIEISDMVTDPTTGMRLTVEDGNSFATPDDLDKVKYKNRKRFYVGPEQIGYTHVMLTKGEKAGTMALVPEFRDITQQHGHALWQEDRTIGLSSVTDNYNGWMHFRYEDVVVEPVTRTMPVFGKRTWNGPFDREVVGVREYTTKRRVIQRKVPVIKTIEDAKVADPFMAIRGVHPTERIPKNRAIVKQMKNIGLTDYVVGKGDEILDRLLGDMGITSFSLKSSRPKFRNPKIPIEKVVKRYSGRTAMFIVDELHAAQGIDTDVGVAIRNCLMEAGIKGGLTGTLFRGYASTMYPVVFVFSEEVMNEYPWPYGEPNHWINDMGTTKHKIALVRTYSSSGDWTGKTRYQKVGKPSEAPGYSAAIYRILAPITVFGNLSDMRSRVQPRTEYSHVIEMDPDHRAVFESAQLSIEDYNSSKIVEGDMSFAGAYYTTLRFASSQMHNTWTVYHRSAIDPREKKPRYRTVEVVKIPSLGPGLRAKDRKMIEIVKEALANNEGVIIYVEQTGRDRFMDNPPRDIQPRIQEILEQNIPGANPIVLYSTSPQAAKRAQYIRDKVAEGHNILICHPALIKEGVDMSWASTTIFYEIGTQISVIAQASVRTWGLKQKKPIKVHYLIYDDGLFETLTASATASKLAAMAMMHGTDVGEFAGEVEDVDLMPEVMTMLREGKIKDLREKASRNALSSGASSVTFDIDETLSPWYSEEDDDMGLF